MFDHLQIPYREERALVGLADAALRAAAVVTRTWRTRGDSTGPARRILLLRLERIGDLVMVLDAIAAVRDLAPGARIDLVVGGWNAPLARLIAAVDSVETLDAPWMARGRPHAGWRGMMAQAYSWRKRRYDLAINFEPDIRSNLLIALSGARRRVGFLSGGGGSLLTDSIAADPGAHVAANAAALVGLAFNSPVRTGSGRRVLEIPDEARRSAARLMGALSPGGLTVGIQPGAGRDIKEWTPSRFAEVGAQIARTRGAKIVLIGGAADRDALEAVKAAWPSDVALQQLPIETDLVVLAAALERLALFITGDTGPMHLAAAVGTPVLAVFGPSLPSRYAPLSPGSRIVRIDIHCSPCNLMRRPPARCVGHVPDCLEGISSAQVVAVAHEMLPA